MLRFGSIAKRVALMLLFAALCAIFAGRTISAQTDDGCDTSEQVACIPMPSDSSPQTSAASAPSSSASVAAVPAPGALCAPSSCCPQLGLAAQASISAAAVPIPTGGGCPVTWCGSNPIGVAVPGAAAIAAPVPPPVYCPTYRGIYTTINLGNAADVRALRTVSTDALQPYWRGNAFATIAGQIGQLQASGDYATASLKSIQVQSATVDLLSSTASVHTLEHWLYREKSSFDGSLVVSLDEWVSNSYTLSSMPNGWSITEDQISSIHAP
jgi:hypothetical protein